jgi:hypothetical protein
MTVWPAPATFIDLPAASYGSDCHRSGELGIIGGPNTQRQFGTAQSTATAVRRRKPGTGEEETDAEGEWKDQLIARLKQLPPDGFERLAALWVVDLFRGDGGATLMSSRATHGRCLL